MKRFIAITAIVTSALGMLSCEKHSWDKETKYLYKSGDDQGKEKKHDENKEKK